MVDTQRMPALGLVIVLIATGLGGCTAPSGDDIVIGSLLPLTGGLATFGPKMERSAKLAVADVEAAGGLLDGRRLVLVSADSQTSATAAPGEFSRLVDTEGAVAVVGAASSGVTASFLQAAVDKRVVVVTPASTSPALSERENRGYFFRVPGSDRLQAKVMADLVADDGERTANTLFVNNDYGKGFNDAFRENFLAKPGVVVQQVAFEADSPPYDSEVGRASGGPPDALVFIGYPGDFTPIARSMAQRGTFGATSVYLSEGVFDPDYIRTVFDETGGALEGARGTTPQSFLFFVGETIIPVTFGEKFSEEYGEDPSLFSPESYDAVAYIALAIEAAGSADPTVFREFLPRIANAPGQKVADLQEALGLVRDGVEIDYSGFSGDFDWDERGDPKKSTYATWAVGPQGAIEVLERNIVVEA